MCGDTYKDEILKINHDYVSTKTVDATCENDGYHEYVCTMCGDSYKETIKRLGHDYKLSDSKKATCEEDGYKEFTCSRCKDSYKITLTKLGHNYELTDTVNPTCTKEGYKEFTCSRCDDSYKETLDMIPHSYECTKTVEPTCTEDGYNVFTCTVCGNSYTEKTSDALGHEFETVVDHVDSTCTVKGFDIYKCVRCNETEKVELELAPHDYDKTVEINRVESTCATNGYIEYKCKNCDDIYRETLELNPENHKYVLTKSDLTYNYYACEYCGKTYQEYNDKEYTIDLGNGKTTTVVGHYDLAMAEEIGRLVNQRRVKFGVKELNVVTTNETNLGNAALIRGPELVVKYDHTRPNGERAILSFASYAATKGENIAKGQHSAEEVFDDWCNSPGHDNNQTSNKYTNIGIAVFVQKTKYDNYIYHFVQLFS